MKKIEKLIAVALIKITYYITYLMPINKRKISIISYFNSTPGLEFTKLIELLNKDDYLIKLNLSHFNASLWGKFKYLFNFVYQTYLFNTSRLVILDGNNFVYASIKVKAQVHTMQLWHASGAIKRFGSESKRRYDIKGYDSLIVPSEFFKSIYAKYLNTILDNTLVLGVIKTDYLYDQEYLNNTKQQFYLKYPELKTKKIILYAPTFRGDGIEDMNSNLQDIKKLEHELSNEYQLVVKYHPLVKNRQDMQYDLSNEDLYTLLNVAYLVISDYSALVYDATILNKRVLLYLYDLKEYQNNRGLCVNFDDFDIEKSYNIKELIYQIKQENKFDYTLFNKKYATMNDGSSTIRVFELINKIMKEVL